MKNVCIAIAVAGSATLAGAQDFSLSLTPSTSFTAVGGSFSLTVYGDASVGTHLLGGGFSLESNGECVVGMTWTPADWSQFNTDGGYAGDGDYSEVVFGQLVIGGIFPPAPGSELGNAIGSFTVFIDPAMGDFAISFSLVASEPFALETVDAVTGETFRSSAGTLSLGSATVSVVPAPGALPLLGLGVLAAARRRR